MNKYTTHKNFIIRFIVLLIYTIHTPLVFCQIIDTDQPSSRVEWRQIQTNNFQLIFPKEFEKTASSLAEQLDTMIYYASQDLGQKPKKISIILHSNHVEQNGFAQLAPRKVEAFTTPGPESDNTTWLPNLMVHELRHVAQFDKLTGKIQGPFFQQLAFALYGIQLPAWYFEGDAVSIETESSSGGRGRSDAWLLPLQANLRQEKPFDFNKHILGSYKDITAGHYLMGYAMNTYLTNQFGYPIKRSIMEETRRNIWRPFAFNNALKSQTGWNSKRLFERTIDSLKKAWTTPDTAQKETLLFSDQTSFWGHQYLPQKHQSGETFFLKTSPQDIPSIVKTDGTYSEKIMELGYQLTPYFHLNEDYIVWDEIRKDPRFGKQTYNIIRIIDLKSGNIRTLTEKSRVYSPVLDKKSEKVYAVQVDENNVFSLICVDQKTKKLKKITTFPAEYQVQQPMLNMDDTRVAAVLISPKGTTILEIDLRSGDWTPLLPWSNLEFQRPTYLNDDLVFKVNLNGKDDIFRYHRSSQTITQLTDVRLGAYHPSIVADSLLYFSTYESSGYKAVKTNLNDQAGREIRPVFWAQGKLDRHLGGLHFNAGIDTLAIFQSAPYRPLSHLFNFHSLSLSDNNFQHFDNYRPGIFWIANDLLNTTELKIGYQYDPDMEKSSYSASFSYERFYPKFNLSYQNRGQIGYARQQGTQDEYSKYDFREHLYQFTAQVPLVIYRGPNLYNFGIQVGTSYQRRYNLSVRSLSGFYDEIAFPINYQVYFGRNRRRSQMDLLPRWGQNVQLIYRHMPLRTGPQGDILAIRTNFYFPGLVRNHGLRARFSWQRAEGRYQLTRDIPMVSGYAHFDAPEVNNTLLMNYHFPIAYPDWSIGSLSYVKRLHGFLFADYQNLQDRGLAPSSFGLGLSVDLHMFRYVLPLLSLNGKLSYVNVPNFRKVVPSFSLSYSY